MSGGRALGNLVEQRKTLVDLALLDELPGKGQHIRIVGLEGVGLVERRHITDFEEPLDLVLLFGGHQLLDELANLRLALGPHEPVDDLTVDHGVHAGIDWTRKACATAGLASTSTLASSTPPLVSPITLSRIGPSVLHGPHHSAQRSTTTGTWWDRWTTSVSNVASVTSAIVTPNVAAGSAIPGWRSTV